jgi:Zn-dependent alcohol dehydrogenase
MAQPDPGIVSHEKGEPVSVNPIVIADPGRGEAVVQACGVCHTDLYYREGGITNEFRLGHEAAGVVEQVGQGVAEVAPGDCDLGGTVALVAVPIPEMTVELPLLDVFGRGGALKSSRSGDCLPSREFLMLVDPYLQGAAAGELSVRRFGLDDVEGALHRMERGEVLRSVVML